MKYYHMSAFSNLSDINSNGLKAPVYMTDTVEGALMFAQIYKSINGNDIAVFELNGKELEEGSIEVSTDHAREVINTEAYYYNKDIPASAVKLKDVYTI